MPIYSIHIRVSSYRYSRARTHACSRTYAYACTHIIVALYM